MSKQKYDVSSLWDAHRASRRRPFYTKGRVAPGLRMLVEYSLVVIISMSILSFILEVYVHNKGIDVAGVVKMFIFITLYGVMLSIEGARYGNLQRWSNTIDKIRLIFNNTLKDEDGINIKLLDEAVFEDVTDEVHQWIGELGCRSKDLRESARHLYEDMLQYSMQVGFLRNLCIRRDINNLVDLLEEIEEFDEYVRKVSFRVRQIGSNMDEHEQS